MIIDYMIMVMYRCEIVWVWLLHQGGNENTIYFEYVPLERLYDKILYDN